VKAIQQAYPEATVELWATDQHRIGLKPILRRIWVLCWLLGPSVLEKRYKTRKQPGALKKNRPLVSACHAGLLADNRTPVGSCSSIYASIYYYYNMCANTSKSPSCAGSLVSAFLPMLFNDAVLMALLHINSTRIDLQFVCWLHGTSIRRVDGFAFHFCSFSKLWHASMKGCKSISRVSIHDAEVDAVHPHSQ
jgi:hypothetical protein